MVGNAHPTCYLLSMVVWSAWNTSGTVQPAYGPTGYEKPSEYRRRKQGEAVRRQRIAASRRKKFRKSQYSLSSKPGSFYGMNHILPRLKLGLHGSHQVGNAALALAVCEILQSSGQAHIPLEAIRHGLKKAHWPGRLEVASEAPLLILDGTHNLMAARVLARHLNDCLHLRFRTGAHHEEHEGHEEWNLVSFRIVLLDVQ